SPALAEHPAPPPSPVTAGKSASSNVTHEAVLAARAFLATFDPRHRGEVQFPFVLQHSGPSARTRRTGPDQSSAPVTGVPRQTVIQQGPGPGSPVNVIGERYGMAVWSGFPVNEGFRPGVQINRLTPDQRAAALRLLQTLLSAGGYRTVQDVMEADQALTNKATPFVSGKATYSIAIFGQPSDTAPWMVQFGGRHLGLNIVIEGTHTVMAPRLTGAHPSAYRRGDRTIRILAEENDRAFAFLDSLDPAQRQQAILPYTVEDIVQGPGHGGETLVPEGIRGSALNAAQKDRLMELIGAWVGIMNDAYAAPRMREIRQELDETWFAWSGPTTHEPGVAGSSYYRIQGPRLLIEFSPQHAGAHTAPEVHTVYQDPTNSYGSRLSIP
ncbi:MAG: DUF3500 domain-containing protein, partial [Acetobacter sp.]|uniref:DUF3500 domain-containing protein n=1 Tax=Acetobacter sp. TaxID=440 RepID=UPI0039ECC356